MGKIRVLVVDDAVVIRKIVTDNLSADPEIEVVGTAVNGKVALEKVKQLRPDVVTMDIEMPEMDGITAVRELRKMDPQLPIIMFSTLSVRGGSATLEALAAGAADYVTKPANVGGVSTSQETVREQLLTKIKTLGRQGALKAPALVSGSVLASIAPRSTTIARPKFFSTPARPSTGKVGIVAIGVSTGGPNALAELMPKLPKNLPVPIVIVQHMPPMFTKLLADRLNTQCDVAVFEAEHGQKIEPGSAYIAPGDFHMEVHKKEDSLFVHLQQEAPENSCRPAVDVLFRSVVRNFGGDALGVILTGMGYDGLRGCQELRAAGGQIIAQDKESSVVWGMPGAVAEAQLADMILPLGLIAPEIIGRTLKADPLVVPGRV